MMLGNTLILIFKSVKHFKSSNTLSDKVDLLANTPSKLQRSVVELASKSGYQIG